MRCVKYERFGSVSMFVYWVATGSINELGFLAKRMAASEAPPD